MDGGRSATEGKDAPAAVRWPTWARVLTTLALLYHASAVWVGAWAPGPSSELERQLVGPFDAYYQATNQGFSYRYYSPEPPIASPGSPSAGPGRGSGISVSLPWRTGCSRI